MSARAARSFGRATFPLRMGPTLLVLNGPNLNLLGTREPAVYGAASLDDLEAELRSRFPDRTLHFEQHNSEGALIDALHRADTVATGGVVFNPGGYTHTSVALRDAVAAISTPVVEVHLTNPAARESFRHTSMIAPVCVGTIAGFGQTSYHLAVLYLSRQGIGKTGDA